MQSFVGNFAYTTTEAEVRELFEAYGVVERVNLITDRETGRLRGFGFAEMPGATEGQAAITGLNGTMLGGGHSMSTRRVRVRSGVGRVASRVGRGGKEPLQTRTAGLVREQVGRQATRP
jgi:RNA recognition motif-containing protein